MNSKMTVPQTLLRFHKKLEPFFNGAQNMHLPPKIKRSCLLLPYLEGRARIVGNPHMERPPGADSVTITPWMAHVVKCLPKYAVESAPAHHEAKYHKLHRHSSEGGGAETPQAISVKESRL
jgi:hypothetical protein